MNWLLELAEKDLERAKRGKRYVMGAITHTCDGTGEYRHNDHNNGMPTIAVEAALDELIESAEERVARYMNG